MNRVAIDDLESGPTAGTAARHDLSEALVSRHVAINHYVVAPGERISGLHAHGDQEECFLVLDGTATIETLDGEVELDADEAIRFEPGEYQSVTNDAARELALLAIGAPPESEDVRIPLSCPDCDYEYREPALLDSGPALICPDCGFEEPATCPACGGEDLYAALGHHEEPVSVCADCGTATEP
ncbi:cupin domain-containing protein [Salinarchaeum sp. Harcht-Bsk1]|uniref:cupin domain-containing protein n=1 Tax=Salinarchaeum sp. Harcht-Bsk1 TaxID=1333523 RepID=UPI0003423C1C|nr:cupin domain-containing protein [Salinarchaeum sp. Harcht-Bsk1]AGN02809.1 cupin domain-containing protein [Salinarchaeum sp. Harcht-Bsk1]